MYYVVLMCCFFSWNIAPKFWRLMMHAICRVKHSEKSSYVGTFGCFHGMDDMIGEPKKEMGGWPGVLHISCTLDFLFCHTSTTVPYLGPVLSLPTWNWSWSHFTFSWNIGVLVCLLRFVCSDGQTHCHPTLVILTVFFEPEFIPRVGHVLF
jgi:hypothetical protein